MQTTRAAIVGTAQSWKRTPWNDPGLYIASLNDAYMMGLPRADEWWELHPLDRMVFRSKTQKVVRKEDVPHGYFVRPEGHIEWLKQQAQAIPVWLQADPPAGWPPNARRFPLEEMEAQYGAYWASGPAYMLMSLYERGFREIHIYGIHLATQHEYMEQRPNFETLIGRLLGPHVTLTEANQIRTYQGADVTIVLPSESPILQHGWRYAYEPKPQTGPDPYDAEWQAVQQEKHALVKALIHWPTGKDKSRAQVRLQRLEIIEEDIRHQRAKRMLGGTLTAQLVA